MYTNIFTNLLFYTTKYFLLLLKEKYLLNRKLIGVMIRTLIIGAYFSGIARTSTHNIFSAFVII